MQTNQATLDDEHDHEAVAEADPPVPLLSAAFLDAELAAKYSKIWAEHLQRSEAYEAPTTPFVEPKKRKRY